MSIEDEKKEERQRSIVREEQIIGITSQVTNPMMIEMLFEGKLQELPYYKIPLNHLIYNKYNGRILSRTKSIESLGKKIRPDTPEGKKTISKLLYDSKPAANKKTELSLRDHGQEKVGVISKDGVIIDGNRRAMLLNRIPKWDFFKAVVLPLSSYDDPLEIEHFETQIQMGGDKAVDYDPIEIYLKIQSMYFQMSEQKIENFDPKDDSLMAKIFAPKFDRNDKNEKSIAKIYDNIGSYKTINRQNDIEFFLETMNTMDEYLFNLGMPEAYPALDGKEEQFRGLTRSIGSFYGETSKKPFSGYGDHDIDDLKFIAFDLIRMKLENETFRYVAGGTTQTNHIIGESERWRNFHREHLDIMTGFSEAELDSNIDPEHISKILSARDAEFNGKVGEDLRNNVKKYYESVRYKQVADQPEKLIDKMEDVFSAINTKSDGFARKKVQKKAIDVAKKIINSVGDKAALLFLGEAIAWLNKMNKADSTALLNNIEIKDKPELIKALKDLQKKSYALEKKVKKVIN